MAERHLPYVITQVDDGQAAVAAVAVRLVLGRRGVTVRRLVVHQSRPFQSRQSRRR